MMQKFMLGAYWDQRADSLEKCVQDAARFFAGLAEIDPLLAHWYERGGSRKDALERKVDVLNSQKIRNLLLGGRNRRDVGGEVIDELGFKLGLWNGANVEKAEASITVHCGSFGERVGNSVVIHLPYQAEGLEWVGKASSLLSLVANIWRPKWAGIMSKKAMRERGFDADYPFVDWMLYLPSFVESVPPPGRVEALDSLGSVVVVQPDPPSGDSPEELFRIRRVESLLAV